MRKEDFFIGVILVAVALAGRTFLHVAPNVEFVTAAALLAGVLIRSRYYFVIPLAIMMLSDLIIGNTVILVFTWSAFLLPAFLGRYVKRWEREPIKLIFSATAGGVMSALFFFLWTNFGVWLLGWYPPTFHGLMACYIMAIPFLKLNLIGNLVIVPSLFALACGAKQLVPMLSQLPAALKSRISA
jgi:hypothetical protein